MLAKADEIDGFVYKLNNTGTIAQFTAYTGKENVLVFPKIEGVSVIRVRNGFVIETPNAQNIEAVDLTNVTLVRTGAFANQEIEDEETLEYYKVGFSNLKKVILGNNTVIEEGAFSGVAITELAFSDTIATNISGFASTVTTVDLSSVTTIGDGAFQGFAQLNTIKNFEGVTSIGSFAFSGCTGLTNIDLSNVTSIGASAFGGCTGLSSVNLSKVTTIGASAFQNCGNPLKRKGLQNVVWSESLTEFPAEVFYGCAMLESVTNLDSATVIGDYAFYNCSSLNGTKEFSSALSSVGKDAFMGTNLTSVVLKSNPSLNASAFPDAVALNLEIEDKMAFSDDNENTFDKITYVRDFSSAKFSTLVLPFVPDQIDQLEVYQLSEQNDNNLIFEEVNVFVPGTPYMVKVKGENVSLSELTGTKQMITKNEQGYIVEAGDWNMIGTYSGLELNASDANDMRRRFYYYTSADGGKFLYATGSLVVSPFRTYIDGPIVDKANNVRMMTRRFDGMETEIDVVELEDVFNPAMGDFYDLKGCRVLAPVEGGVYIVNGKKIVF